MAVNDSYFIIDEDAPYGKDFLNALIRNLNVVSPNLADYVLPKIISLGIADCGTTDSCLRDFCQEELINARYAAVRDGNAPNFDALDFERVFSKRRGRRGRLLCLIVNGAVIDDEEQRKRLVEKLDSIQELFAAFVVVALSENDVELNDRNDLDKIAESFVRKESEYWTRVVVCSLRSQFRGRIVSQETLIKQLTSLLAQDVVYKEDRFKRVFCEPPVLQPFSYEVFSSRLEQVDFKALAETLLPIYEESLINGVRKDSEPSVPLQQSTSELLDTFVKGTIFTTERTGGSGTHLVTAENEKYKLVAESWRYTEPRHNKAETLHYLEKIARNYSADSDAFAKMTHKSASKIIRWQYETFKDFIVKSALWSSTSDAFRELLDKALQNVESCFKIDVEKDDRDETNNFSCKEELERIPRFFPYYLAFVALFLLLSGVLFYQNKLIMGGCLSIVSLLGVVTFLILRETSWGRCEEAVRADYDRIKQFQLNKALSALALEIQRCRESLRIALGAKGVSPLSNDDEKVNNLRTFALNVQEALTRKTHGRIPRFPNMRLFPKERVPELFNYLNQKYELTNDIESFKELLARVTKESLNDESKESDYVEKQIDEYCKTRLWKYLNNLELSFFLRENFDDARMNHNRLREIIIPDYNDIYARGALIQKIVDDDEEEKRRGNRINKKTLTRKYLFAPEGINIERAHNYNKIVTNWKQACLAGQFWQLYDPTVHMNDKVITEEKTKEEVKLGTCEITAETEVVQNASTTRETRGNNAPDRKAFNEE